MNIKKAFGAHLKQLREERGLNQDELGVAVGGLSRASTSLYEKGERVPDIEMMCCLAEFFGVSADYMVGLTDIRQHDDVEGQVISRRLALSAEAVKMLESYANAKGSGACPEIDTVHLLLDNLRGVEGGRLLRALAAFFDYDGGNNERELEEELLMLKVTKELYSFKASIVCNGKKST